jgi:uncharacterized protein
LNSIKSYRQNLRQPNVSKQMSNERSQTSQAAVYDCQKCPGYCCSYPVIQVSKPDVARLARFFDLSVRSAEIKFTRSAHGYKRVLRRKNDVHFGKICSLFDSTKRCCSVYTARPKICRIFPQEKYCGYWDFLSFERKHQKDLEAVAITDNGRWS